MSVPTRPVSLVINVYKKIFPAVHKQLNYWKKRANEIPNQELRKQALASIETKTFHCEGGAIMALLSKKDYDKVIPFIVAYQTISDYLDNLCDRSTSLDPKDFEALHESMIDALTVGITPRNYYRYRDDQDDGGYLKELVSTCQRYLSQCRNYSLIKEDLLELCKYYCELQVHKHVHWDERVFRLKNWFSHHQTEYPNLYWYEFSASTGSTLGIFCLVSYAVRNDFKPQFTDSIRKGYFPYIQGLHILLDYFIDQEEDKQGGDLNFCFYYEDKNALQKRLEMFIKEADRHTANLPNQKFHQLINRGMLGIYLSDNKLKLQDGLKEVSKKLIRNGGWTSYFFYMNAKGYRRLRDFASAKPPSGMTSGN